MKIAVCVDDNNGMIFNKRRQSKDKKVRAYLLEQLGEHKLWMNEYTKKQFEEDDERICVSEDFLEQAGEEDLCFVENVSVLPYEEKISSILIIHWNRKYPADLYLDIDYKSDMWTLTYSEEFIGNSHPEILIEEYVKSENTIVPRED